MTEKLYTESEVQARLALLLREMSRHQIERGQSWNAVACSCGWECKFAANPSDPTPEWRKHILSLSPNLDKVLTSPPQEAINVMNANAKLQADNAALREALREIQEVASGERQVAVDDTAGMEWIDRKARALLRGKPLANAELRYEPGHTGGEDERSAREL